MERREFCRNCIYGSSLLIAAPVLFNACCDDLPIDNTIDLNDPDYAKLKIVGGYAYKDKITIIRDGLTIEDDIIIIRYSETEYLALSKVCTHQGYTVSYNSSGNYLPCPKHGSIFSITGDVLNDPATVPLQKYNVSQDGNILTIS